jgi:hypothetical protein
VQQEVLGIGLYDRPKVKLSPLSVISILTKLSCYTIHSFVSLAPPCRPRPSVGAAAAGGLGFGTMGVSAVCPGCSGVARQHGS